MHDDKIATALGLRPLEEAKNENSTAENGKALQETNKTLLTSQAQESPEGRIENDSFDIATTESGSVNPPALIDNGAEENLEDLEEARQNVKGVIETGDEALREMLEIAKQSEHPRAFEVVSTLMKTMLDANKDLADISTKKRFVKEEIASPKEAAQTNVTNNNLIVSTADLLKMIKGENEDG